MRGAKIYGIIIAITVVVYILFEWLAPRSVSWDASLKYTDKKPYGTYVLYKSLEDLFPNTTIKTNHENYYELWENDTTFNHSMIIIRPSFYSDEYSIDALLDYVNEGNDVFISSFAFDSYLLDSLGIGINSKYLGKNGDSIHLKLNHDSNAEGVIKYANKTYFSPYSNAHFPYKVYGKSGKTANLILFHIGKGNLCLHSSPIALTNYNILNYNTYEYVETLFSILPNQDILWDVSLDMVETEDRNALRYIHSEEHLNRAYYLLVFLLILYIIFKIKREQRPIPIVEPPVNNSLELVDSVSQLYIHNKSHKHMADKMIRHFFDYIHTKYFIRSQVLNDAFIDKLSRKSGQDKNEVKTLVKLIQVIRSSESISDTSLLDLNNRIEKFKQDKNTKS
jgi:hypothetical protein